MDSNQQNQNSITNPTVTNPQVNLPQQTPPTSPIPQPTEQPKESIHSSVAKRQIRDSRGKFVSKDDPTKLPPISVSTNNVSSVNTTNPPDLVNLKITNPLVYIKYWWRRIMANEGIDMRFRVKPLTVFGIALIAFSLAFGLGGVVLPKFFPWIKFNNYQATSSPTTTPEPWKETALKGTLKKTTTLPTKFFLLTSSDEAVTLQVPEGINLTPLISKRILAVGTYNQKQKLLIVSDIQDLEVLPTTPVPIPTSSPTPVPTQGPTETNMPASSQTPIPTGESEPTP